MVIQFSTHPPPPHLKYIWFSYSHIKREGRSCHANILNSVIIFSRTIKHKLFSNHSDFPFSSIQAGV